MKNRSSNNDETFPGDIESKKTTDSVSLFMYYLFFIIIIHDTSRFFFLCLYFYPKLRV